MSAGTLSCCGAVLPGGTALCPQCLADLTAQREQARDGFNVLRLREEGWLPALTLPADAGIICCGQRWPITTAICPTCTADLTAGPFWRQRRRGPSADAPQQLVERKPAFWHHATDIVFLARGVETLIGKHLSIGWEVPEGWEVRIRPLGRMPRAGLRHLPLFESAELVAEFLAPGTTAPLRQVLRVDVPRHLLPSSSALPAAFVGLPPAVALPEPARGSAGALPEATMRLPAGIPPLPSPVALPPGETRFPRWPDRSSRRRGVASPQDTCP